MKPVRVGLVGCGKVGTIHAAVLASIPEATFVGVFDTQAERAQAFAAFPYDSTARSHCCPSR